MKKKQKLYRVLFFSIILLYFICKLIYGIFIKQQDTEIISFGELITQREYECLIVRDERIVKSPSEGSIKYYVTEGEKVEKNHKIGEIYTANVNDGDRKKLKQLNGRIDEIQSSTSNLFEIDIDKLNIEIDNIVDDIRNARIQGELGKIYKLQDSLASKVDKKRRVSGDKSFSGANLDKLKGEKQELESKIKNSILEINSPESGIVSYYIDGFEEILTPYNLTNIKYEAVKTIESNINKLNYDKVISNQPVFKLTDNTAWYIIIITDPEDAKTFKIGKKVFIDVSDTRIKGKIIDRVNDEAKGFIIVRTNQYVSDFNKIRKLNLNIVKEQYEGLKIHRDSIIEKEGQYGVFLLNVNRKAIFKPIKILGYDENYAIVKNYSFDVKEGDSLKKVRTVKLYDEILRYGKEYKEEDIID